MISGFPFGSVMIWICPSSLEVLCNLASKIFLANMPTLHNFELCTCDLDLWKAAIKKLKPGSARGIDKISVQELKLLPDAAIQS